MPQLTWVRILWYVDVVFPPATGYKDYSERYEPQLWLLTALQQWPHDETRGLSRQGYQVDNHLYESLGLLVTPRQHTWKFRHMMNNVKFEDSDLGCEAVSLGEHFSTFETLRSTHTTSPASHLRRLDSSAQSLWQPEMGFSDDDVKKLIFRHMTSYQMKKMIMRFFNITSLTHWSFLGAEEFTVQLLPKKVGSEYTTLLKIHSWL